MYGVSKISIEPSLMMISVQDVEFKGNSLARYLQIFADTGVVVDMISQAFSSWSPLVSIRIIFPLVVRTIKSG